MISVYNIHHSPQVWDNAEEFLPERFNLDDPVPNESNTDFKYEKYPSPDLFSRYRPFFFFFSTNLKSVSYLILMSLKLAFEACKQVQWDEQRKPFRIEWRGEVLFEYQHWTVVDCRYIPFSGGPRKCVGDQFAMLEATVALAVLLQRFNFRLVPDQIIGMTTGATIHTTTVCTYLEHAPFFSK